MMKLATPTNEEYAPFYSDYIQRALQRGSVYDALSLQMDEFHTVFDTLSDTQARFKPGPEEWSVKEVIGHINDVERVFSYRLLRVARGDATPLPGFEQEDYVRAAGFDHWSLSDLVSEFEHLRRANILIVQHMDDETVNRCGVASGATVSVRALIHMLVGHVEHHIASLHEKYLSRP